MGNYEIYFEEDRKVYEYLDSLDLTGDIVRYAGKELFDLMTFLSSKYSYKTDFVNGLFDSISLVDFQDYLNSKYNVDIYERTDYVISGYNTKSISKK